MKYTPDFPDRFGSIGDARSFMGAFAEAYNHEHHHTGIGLHTPADVHYGHTGVVSARRSAALAVARAAHPERFTTDHDPKILVLPSDAWINWPCRPLGCLTPTGLIHLDKFRSPKESAPDRWVHTHQIIGPGTSKLIAKTSPPQGRALRVAHPCRGPRPDRGRLAAAHRSPRLVRRSRAHPADGATGLRADCADSQTIRSG